MKESDKETYIAEETFVIQHSGEIPEVTLQESLYFLAEDPEGPGLRLDPDDILPLKQAVVKRYRTIILRDLDPGNRDKKIYRGLARCTVNWHRLLKFCFTEKIDPAKLQREIAAALQNFLQQEATDVLSGMRTSSINCASQDIEKLAASLGLSRDDLPEGWQDLCTSAG